MTSAVLRLSGAALLVIAAGNLVTVCADIIAERWRISRLVVGAVFLAFATSLPELFVNFHAVRLGDANLAVGDLMGSCLLNLVMLAIFDALKQTPGRLFTHESSSHALSAAGTIALSATAGAFILAAPRGEFCGLGWGSVLILLTYGIALRLVYFDQLQALAKIDKSDWPHTRSLPPRRAVVGYLFGAALLFFACPELARAATELAAASGLGSTFVGSTLVAATTTLPEAVTTVSAIRAGALDLAAGSVFGSNAFNMVILALLDFVQPGPLLSQVAPVHAMSAVFVVLVTSVYIMGELYRVEKRYWILEPDAAVVIGLSILAFVLLYGRK